MRKNLIVFLAFLLCLCAALTFASCKNNDNTDKPAEDIVLVEGGASKFYLITDNRTALYVKNFVAQVEKVAGVQPEIFASDRVPEDGVKVFFGNPNDFEGIEPIVSTIPYFGYANVAYNGDIYCLAYDESVLSEAVSALQIKLSTFMADGKLKMAGDYSVIKETSNKFGAGAVPYFEGGSNPRVFDCDDKHHMVLLQKVEKDSFDKYCTDLEGAGFELNFENEIKNNVFKTYYKADTKTMVHTYWVKHSKEVRTVVGKINANLLPANSNTGNNTYPVLLHTLQAIQPNEEDNRPDGGMGYIIRLADGRFFVIDGGGRLDTHAQAIYKFMKENAPDPNNIVIASWFITHAHSDHFGAFDKFASIYGDDPTVTLQSIMKNFCATPEQSTYVNTSGNTIVNSAIAAKYPTVPVYKVLTGQVYTFATTSIEILYTPEDFMPRVITQESDVATKGQKNGDSNVLSVVTRVDIVNNADKGDLFFVMADTTKVACDEICDRYGSYIKSDMVQVSHHGIQTDTDQPRRHNSTREIYKLINPKIAFWPTHKDRFEARKNLSVNSYLRTIIKNNNGANYIAGNSARTFEF